ncbi:hypothetical protein KPL47_11855 [Clostridium estertheticum]|uniref:hypothetical protein n=1 Tax=Clostridium estertheticum TaxID=238834 RepID=UPI001C0C1F25|nr:hypothetical protein [Clostridium estertheticum]MBU3177049.1 hypothetical protein [Clostridium estertheticum]
MIFNLQYFNSYQTDPEGGIGTTTHANNIFSYAILLVVILLVFISGIIIISKKKRKSKIK